MNHADYVGIMLAIYTSRYMPKWFAMVMTICWALLLVLALFMEHLK